MHSNRKRWLHYAFVTFAIVGSLVSLFALFELGVPSWTTPLNILSVVCILLAIRTRRRGADTDDG